MRLKSRVYLVGITVVLLIFASQSVAEENDARTPTELFVQNISEEFVAGSPDRETDELSIRVLVKGSVGGTVSVEMVDYSDQGGNRTPLPAGTVPNSLAFALSIPEQDLTYDPKTGNGIFEVKLPAKTNLKAMIYSGGIRIGFQPDSVSVGAQPNSLGIEKNIIVSPYGVSDLLPPGTLKASTITETSVRPLERSSFIDSLLPDIPGVINFGPVESRVTYANPGTYPNFTTVDWEFFQDETLLARQSVEKSLLPSGKSITKAAQTLIVDGVTGRSLNPLPSSGFVTVKIVIGSSLSGKDLEDSVSTTQFLIIQWKEPVFIFGSALLLLYFLLKTRRRVLDRQSQEKKQIATEAEDYKLVSDSS